MEPEFERPAGKGTAELWKGMARSQGHWRPRHQQDPLHIWQERHLLCSEHPAIEGVPVRDCQDIHQTGGGREHHADGVHGKRNVRDEKNDVVL